MADVRVKLCTLSIRTSKRGSTYVSGWLGKARLVGWAGEPDKFGNRTIDLFVTPQEERREQRMATVEGDVAHDPALDWNGR